MEEILKALFTFLGGGAALWAGFKFLYPDLIRPINSRIAAKKSFYEHLDPILKAASELYGKLESLAKEDFSTFINVANSISSNPEHNRKYVFYLFAQFWAQLEYLRLVSQYTSISKVKKGKELLRFIETIESRKFRILDRSIQRIIGECLITGNDQKFRIMTLKDFLNELDQPNSNLTKWIAHLEVALSKVNGQEERQLFLRFGVIVNALIDHFDSKHTTVRKRDIYKNKLSTRSNLLLRNNLFNHYLPFISNKSRYFKENSGPQVSIASKKQLEPLDQLVSLEKESIKIG